MKLLHLNVIYEQHNRLKHMKLLHLNVIYEQHNRFINLRKKIIRNFIIFFRLFSKIVAKRKYL